MLFDKLSETLEALIYVAINSAAHPVCGREICEKQHLPTRHFEPVLQMLVHEGILRGSKGPKGGYSLAIEKRKISVGDVFRALRKLERHSSRYKVKSDVRVHIVRPVIKEINIYLLQRLDEITLEELCDRARMIDDIKAEENQGDFSI